MNRLADEKSPYLLQHADNPVDWHPWGEEAFAKARAENKPIFLSVGYSTCHWCHVMAHESFEDPATAEIMNREFVNIKVDREERPDVDRVYMTFVQATTGGGGWPMSVWLTPELKPFVGGTYFPPDDRYGHPAFQKVLGRIANAWRENHEQIAEQGTKVIAALADSLAEAASFPDLVGESALEAAFQQFARSYDAAEGGFGHAPKFPRPSVFNFLFRFYARDRKSEDGKQALEMALLTLRKMAAGGIHDHLGGGFARYSVDTYWHVPHFEKMLYDQGQLAVAYVEAFQITRAPLFEEVARDILEYVRRDMTSAEGGFFSAEDADSLDPVAAVYERQDRAEDGGQRPALQKKSEGAFYIWTKKEIDNALGDAAELFAFHYGVQPHGNVPTGSDPHDEFLGRNILIQRQTVAETAAHFGRSEAETRRILEESRAKLFALRATRPRPHLDDKIIAAWNGLMISGFARAARVLGDGTYLESAVRAARFVRDHLAAGATLIRSYRVGASNIRGFAEDYAFVIQGLLDLYDASAELEWLKFAVALQQTQDRLFFDHQTGGYFSATGDDPSILLRMKEDNDGAEPAATSVAALNLLRLAQLLNETSYRERAEKTIAAFGPQLSRYPSALPQMLVALIRARAVPQQIVIGGNPDAADVRGFIDELRQHFLPNATVLLANARENQEYLARNNPALREMPPVDGKAAAYVCENFTCQAPVTDPAALRALLA